MNNQIVDEFIKGHKKYGPVSCEVEQLLEAVDYPPFEADELERIAEKLDELGWKIRWLNEYELFAQAGRSVPTRVEEVHMVPAIKFISDGVVQVWAVDEADLDEAKQIARAYWYDD